MLLIRPQIENLKSYLRIYLLGCEKQEVKKVLEIELLEFSFAFCEKYVSAWEYHSCGGIDFIQPSFIAVDFD